MKAATIDGSRPVSCQALHYNFSPKGGLEGLIVEVGGRTAQVVCPPHLAHELAGAVGEGDTVELVLSEAGPSDKGPAAHPVYYLEELPHADVEDHVVRGTVTRLNFAKHGEANGVVLDTGDFVHLKPDGMKQLELKVGDRVTAEGETRPMDHGGRVVEATAVNGTPVKRKPKHH